MALSLTFEKYADYLKVWSVDASVTADGTYSIRKSFTDDVDYSDQLFSQARVIGQAINWGLEDRSLVQGHTYFYWVYFDYGGVGESLLDSGSARLTQHILFGRGGGLKGAKRQRTWDYDVECPLCGKNCRRNLLRRGYVRPHTSGINYLPNAAAPENWTWDVNPYRFDANVVGGSIETEAIVFPQIEKDSDLRSPPGQNRWPGVPIVLIGTPQIFATVGTPATAGSGTCIAWFYVPVGGTNFATPRTPNIQVIQDVNTIINLTKLLDAGWHRMSAEYTWDNVNPIKIEQKGFADDTGGIGYGGVMLTTATGRDAEIATLPHRSSGSGVYTTGGMMDLCPECYSGLRKRVPWG